jgi:hypothetical protein
MEGWINKECKAHALDCHHCILFRWATSHLITFFWSYVCVVTFFWYCCYMLCFSLCGVYVARMEQQGTHQGTQSSYSWSSSCYFIQVSNLTWHLLLVMHVCVIFSFGFIIVFVLIMIDVCLLNFRIKLHSLIAYPKTCGFVVFFTLFMCNEYLLKFQEIVDHDVTIVQQNLLKKNFLEVGSHLN